MNKLKFDILIKNAKCLISINKKNLKIEKTNILIKNNKIWSISNKSNKKIIVKKEIDAKGLYLIPGVIDSHVHFRDPGAKHKENINCASMSAILGGVTSVIDMPNNNPPTINLKELKNKIKKFDKKSWCNYAFFLGATKNNIKKLHLIEKSKAIAGIKIFWGSSTGDLLLNDSLSLSYIAKNCIKPLVIHSEDESRIKKRYYLAEKYRKVHLHSIWRDEKSAFNALKEIINVIVPLERKIHLLHVNCRAEINLLERYKKLISAECTPHHLSFFAPQCYKKLNTLAQVNPPIRSKLHQKKLWEGIKKNLIQSIGSDHAPHTLEEKNKTYPNSPSGMPGVQTLLPIMLNHINKKNLNLKKLVQLTSHHPANIFNIKNKGFIEEGFDADLVLIDLKLKKTISNSWIKSLCGWTAYANETIQGWPIMTILNGKIVMHEDEIIGKPQGKLLQFN